MFEPDQYTDSIDETVHNDTRVNASGGVRSHISSIDISGIEYQAVTYYDENDQVVIGVRQIGGAWTLYTYDGTGGLPNLALTVADDHRTTGLGIDSDGYIHFCYDMHGSALKYRKSSNPINSFDGSVSGALSMLGTNEAQVTYPMFFTDPNGILYFIFRDGSSGHGDNYFYTYDTGTTSWSASSGTGANGRMIYGNVNPYSAYINHPCFDEDFGSGGYMHISWNWHDDGPPVTRFDLSYAKWDGTNWYQADGSAQTMAITRANCEVIDPVPAGDDFPSHNNTWCDSQGRPHIAYAKEGDDGYRHIYHAYYDSGWTITQVTLTPSPIGLTDEKNLVNVLIIIDRTDDTAYIYYVDEDADRKGLLVSVSNPNDYSTWIRRAIYPNQTGKIAPSTALDIEYWLRNGSLIFLIAYWAEAQATLPIRTLETDIDTFYPDFVYLKSSNAYLLSSGVPLISPVQ